MHMGGWSQLASPELLKIGKGRPDNSSWLESLEPLEIPGGETPPGHTQQSRERRERHEDERGLGNHGHMYCVFYSLTFFPSAAQFHGGH